MATSPVKTIFLESCLNEDITIREKTGTIFLLPNVCYQNPLFCKYQVYSTTAQIQTKYANYPLIEKEYSHFNVEITFLKPGQHRLVVVQFKKPDIAYKIYVLNFEIRS